jgi:hypothetical protein
LAGETISSSGHQMVATDVADGARKEKGPEGCAESLPGLEEGMTGRLRERPLAMQTVPGCVKSGVPWGIGVASLATSP